MSRADAAIQGLGWKLNTWAQRRGRFGHGYVTVLENFGLRLLEAFQPMSQTRWGVTRPLSLASRDWEKPTYIALSGKMANESMVRHSNIVLYTAMRTN
jgi:hypothetical protein